MNWLVQMVYYDLLTILVEVYLLSTNTSTHSRPLYKDKDKYVLV